MKIVYVITRSDVVGGASVHLLDLASGVQNEHNNVTILSGGNGIVTDLARARNLKCITLNNLVREISIYKDICGYLELRRIIKKLSPDLIHAHSSKAGILGRLVGKSLKIPVVFTAHGWAFTEGVPEKRRRLYIKIERFIAKFTNQIITVSNYDKNLALKNHVGNDTLITTVHNGIPTIEKLPRLTSENKLVKLVMVARFDTPKNQKFLIKALSEIKDLSWSMDFIGDGPSINQSKELVHDLNLSDKINFLGACSDVSERLINSDVFILISDWEGLPLTILEAMRSGLPVIATNVGGIPEAVEHGETGLLVNINDSINLIDSIRKLIESPDMRRNMGRCGEKKFFNEFKFESMLFKTLKIYKDTINK